MKKIVLTTTGGHFLAALAVIEELGRRGGWQISWIGTSAAFEEVSGVASLEAKILPRLGIPFFAIQSGKVHRGRLWQTALSLPKVLIGLGQSLAVLFRLRPQVVLSFGGHVSIPVTLAAWLLGIPVVIHEQTTTSGLANRLAARWARKVAISYKDSAADFPADKVVLMGNPVRRAILEIARTKKRKKGAPLVYVTGGSRGSRILNQAVFGILPELLGLARVYHQTGELDLPRAREAKKTLGDYLRRRYLIAANFLPGEVENIFQKASLVIGRAGANLVAELEILATPAILVPIPWVEKNEQLKNAQILETQGTGVILPQEELSPRTLLVAVKRALIHPRKFKRKRIGYLLARPSAAKRIVDLLYEVL